MGRPLTKEQHITAQAEICRWIQEEEATYKEACALAGVHHDTVRCWRNDEPDFDEAVVLAERSRDYAIQKRIGDEPGGNKWRLERMSRKEWGPPTQNVDQTTTHKVDAPLEAAINGIILKLGSENGVPAATLPATS